MRFHAFAALALAGCATDSLDTSEPFLLALAGDDAAVGRYDDGAILLDPHLLEALPSGDVHLAIAGRTFALDERAPIEPLTRLVPLQLVVPTDDGAWRIDLVGTEGASDCGARYHTDVWRSDSCGLLGVGELHTWHLFEDSPDDIKQVVASWRVCVPR